VDGSPIGDSLMRSNLDAHGAKSINPMLWWADALTLAGRTLYFDSCGPGAAEGIGQIGIDGSRLQATGLSGFNINPFLTGSFVGQPAGSDGQLASDGSHHYWIGFQYTGTGSTAEVIGRANLDGTDVEHSFITYRIGAEAPERATSRRRSWSAEATSTGPILRAAQSDEPPSTALR
jgi:hypothetical protein